MHRQRGIPKWLEKRIWDEVSRMPVNVPYKRDEAAEAIMEWFDEMPEFCRELEIQEDSI